MSKNKYKIAVRFVNGGSKDFFVDEYDIDQFGMISFIFERKKKRFHVSNVEIENILGDSLE